MSGGLACERGIAASDSQGDYQLKRDKACEITPIWLVLVGNLYYCFHSKVPAALLLDVRIISHLLIFPSPRLLFSLLL